VETDKDVVRGYDGKLYFAESEPVKPPITPEELSAQFTAAINVRLNAFAALRQYDDITSARLAALSADFSEDGHVAQVAYDATWTAAIAIWKQVTSGDLTINEALAQLPALVWPGEASNHA
jgi:hypothetical protein